MSTNTKTFLALAAAVALGALVASDAYADDNTLRINADDVRLRARPNEKAPTLIKLDEGQIVKLLERKGRWLKVQVRGKQGWIPRSYVEEDMRDEDEIVAARESVQDTRGRRSKTNMRRGDKGFDTLDEDARGEDGVSESVEEDDEELDDEDPLAGKKGKKGKQEAKAKKKKRMADDEEEDDEGDDEAEDDEAEDDEDARPRKKAKKVAKAGGIREGATVQLKGKTPVRMKPSKKSDALFEASKGEEVEVIMVNDDDPEFVRIQTEDGSKGWVPRKSLAMAGGRGGGDDEEMDEESDEAGGDEEEGEGDEEGSEDAEASVSGRSGLGGFDVGLAGSVGLVSKAQTFTSAGTDPVKSKYRLGNNAPVVILGATAGKRFGKYMAAGELGYVRSLGGKGITVSDGTMSETVQWVTQQIDVRVVGGYWLSEGKYLIGGGLGYHVGQVAVSGNMIADLPGERVSGIRFGGMFVIPKLTEKIGARASIDTLLGGGLTQQPGLTDGTSSKTTAYYVALGGTYSISPKLSAQAGYLFSYERFNFSGDSERVPDITSARRKDLSHTLGVGVGYDF